MPTNLIICGPTLRRFARRSKTIRPVQSTSSPNHGLDIAFATRTIQKLHYLFLTRVTDPMSEFDPGACLLWAVKQTSPSRVFPGGYQQTQRAMISSAKCLPRKSADRLLCTQVPYPHRRPGLFATLPEMTVLRVRRRLSSEIGRVWRGLGVSPLNPTLGNLCGQRLRETVEIACRVPRPSCDVLEI
jgi:hypothetical protein